MSLLSYTNELFYLELQCDQVIVLQIKLAAKQSTVDSNSPAGAKMPEILPRARGGGLYIGGSWNREPTGPHLKRLREARGAP
ncbi:MAG: hypothetical protein CMJ59_00755, partial [Planctomycetaceae bacterium]|nr:hypothetical protein [Planctomycetaceae bacterium]